MASSQATYRGLSKHFTLPRGNPIPSIGLGTWKAKPDELKVAVKTALEAGYRHIDTAAEYENEEAVGEAIRASGVDRKDIWITTKLWNADHAPEDVEPALDHSLKQLGTDYIDLWLMHWPIAFKKDKSAPYDKELTADQYPTWKKMEEMLDKGKVRNIGVSNFTAERLKTLMSNKPKYNPIINQVELNYFNPQPELLRWCKENGILLEAYSPLGSSKKVQDALDVPVVKEIARKLEVSPSQVYTSWHLQRGVVVIVKSVTPESIRENIEVMKLPDELFDQIEEAAASHPPERSVNPDWGLGFDPFEEGAFPTKD